MISPGPSGSDSVCPPRLGGDWRRGSGGNRTQASKTRKTHKVVPLVGVAGVASNFLNVERLTGPGRGLKRNSVNGDHLLQWTLPPSTCAPTLFKTQARMPNNAVHRRPPEKRTSACRALGQDRFKTLPEHKRVTDTYAITPARGQ